MRRVNWLAIVCALLLVAAPARADDQPLDAFSLRLLMDRMSVQNDLLRQRVNDLKDELEKAQRETKTCIEARTT